MPIGATAHQAGTVRFGTDPAASALDTELPRARRGQPVRRRHQLLPEHRRGEPVADRDGERAAGGRPPARPTRPGRLSDAPPGRDRRRRLRRTVRRAGAARCDVDVVVVDRTTHHLFQPLLYQVATGVLSEGQIAVPAARPSLRRHRNVDCLLARGRLGRRRHAHRARRSARGGEPIDVPYDDLVVAAGVRQSYFGHDEFAEHAPGMKTLADALEIRDRVFGAFEMAGRGERRRRASAVAHVRAGRRRTDRGGAGRPDPGARDAHAAPRVPRHRPGRGPGAALRRRGRAAGAVRHELAGKAARGAHRPRRRAAHALDRHRGGRRRAAGARPATATTTRYDAGTVLWAAGVTAATARRRRGAGRRRRAGPRRPDQGGAGPDRRRDIRRSPSSAT